MRLEIEGEGFGLDREVFLGAFAPLARRHEMEWRVSYTDTPKRMAILVSRYDHCLIDLLWRWDAGELDAEIPLVISSHPDLAARAENYDIPFHHLPVTKETKTEQEARILSLLSESGVNRVVLARYMQVLTAEFVGAYPSGIVNIPHSFLPASSGADAYRRAHERGGQDDRRDRPLRHRRARRRADHPLGRRPRNPPRYRGGPGAAGPGGRTKGAGTRRSLAPGGPGVRGQEPHRRLRVARSLGGSGVCPFHRERQFAAAANRPVTAPGARSWMRPLRIWRTVSPAR